MSTNTITAEEINSKLSGMTSRKLMLGLLDGTASISEAMTNEILSHDPRAAEILERLMSAGICSVTTNRWWPSQYRQLNSVLALPEFATIRNLVESRNTGAGIRILDAKSGNVVMVEISAPTSEAILAAVKSAKKQMAEKKKATAARIAGERSANAE